MHVVATAGHVDHGKSTLVRALTGMDPDRLKEEHQRGLSIALGYCWTTLPGAGEVAFVDVPGHERFIATTLSGLGPVPGVMFVVAADDPWMPQAAEHLAALDALGVRHGVLVVTRADLADPAPALAAARAAMAGTSLEGVPAVTVSGRTGAGLADLRARLAAMVAALPAPERGADVRLWVDRVFHVKGAGTVVTGTLPAGTVTTGDTLALAPTRDAVQRTVRVRAVQSLGRPVEAAHGVARVALNVAGADDEELRRSAVLVTPDRWLFTDVVDVRVPETASVPQRPLLHMGATSTGTHLRPLGDGAARLRLDSRLPLRIGDRALLRDPGSRRVWGVTVLDPAPPPLRRRGAARSRAAELAGHDGVPDLAAELRRRGCARRSLLHRIGVTGLIDGLIDGPTDGVTVVGDWVVSASRLTEWRERLAAVVAGFEESRPLEQGMPVAAAAHALRLPDPEILGTLVRSPLRMVNGRVTGRGDDVLPAPLEAALERLRPDLEEEPFAAPTAERLRELGLDARATAAAARAGRLLRLAEGVVLLPGAEHRAVERLAGLPQPFTTSQARVALGTSRRVALPLLAHLDGLGLTMRHPDDRRSLRGRGSQ